MPVDLSNAVAVPQTFVCVAGGCENDEDVVVWFTPEHHASLLKAAKGAAVVAQLFSKSFFSVSFILQPDAVCSYSAFEEALGEEWSGDREWVLSDAKPPTDADLHVRIDFSKLCCDAKHFWLVVRAKYSDAEYQTDYFAWDDLPSCVFGE